MFKSLFGKKEPEKNLTENAPSILGLRIGHSFEVDALLLRLCENQLITHNIAPTQIIQAAGVVALDDTYIFRFYTDDEGFLQVVSQGGKNDEHVIDVKLYHYFDTLDVSNQHDWDALLNEKIGTPHYMLEGQNFERVWTAQGEYHNPVHMHETTHDDEGNTSHTDQFTMLFERAISNDLFESLFLSAEETESPPGNLNRCLVISTGITLSASQITIHG